MTIKQFLKKISYRLEDGTNMIYTNSDPDFKDIGENSIVVVGDDNDVFTITVDKIDMRKGGEQEHE